MKITTILLGTAAAAAAYGFMKKKRKVPSTGKTAVPGFVLPVVDRPLCDKTGLVTLPIDEQDWSDDDQAVVMAAIDRGTESLPKFATISEAREITFSITRSIVAGLCPNKKMPDAQYNLDNYKQNSPAFAFLWDLVENMTWNRLIG